MSEHFCDKKLEMSGGFGRMTWMGKRQCQAPATLFYQSEVTRQLAARCSEHSVAAYKPEQGALLILSVDAYEAELRKLVER
jgi:hypothetical protein